MTLQRGTPDGWEASGKEGGRWLRSRAVKEPAGRGAPEGGFR